MSRTISRTLAVGAVSLAAFACHDDTLQASGAPQDLPARVAVAELSGTARREIAGTVTLTDKGDLGVEVMVRIAGLAPGAHGFHVHEKGDCTASDAASAGGHFNPENTRHGNRIDEDRHVGDLGNVVANDVGVVEVTFVDRLISLSGPHSVIGRGVIVHEGADDFTTQPSGDAGARVACGVIEWSGGGD